MIVPMRCATERLEDRERPVSGCHDTSRRLRRCHRMGPSERDAVNRYYDPVTGQFMSVDPLVAQTQQAYVYTSDNPMSLQDPTGLNDRWRILDYATSSDLPKIPIRTGTATWGWTKIGDKHKLYRLDVVQACIRVAKLVGSGPTTRTYGCQDALEEESIVGEYPLSVVTFYAHVVLSDHVGSLKTPDGEMAGVLTFYPNPGEGPNKEITPPWVNIYPISSQSFKPSP